MQTSSIEIWVLQPPPLQKELPEVTFLAIYRTTTLQNNLGGLHCYEVALVKNCNKPLLQKSETNIFDQKRFVKNLFKVNDKNNPGVLRINQITSKSLTLSKGLQLTC